MGQAGTLGYGPRSQLQHLDFPVVYQSKGWQEGVMTCDTCIYIYFLKKALYLKGWVRGHGTVV